MNLEEENKNCEEETKTVNIAGRGNNNKYLELIGLFINKTTSWGGGDKNLDYCWQS